MIASDSAEKRKYLPILTKTTIVFILWIHTGVAVAPGGAEARANRSGGDVYITDRAGDRWNVSQAASIGFDPHGFQFGTGRQAITPLTMKACVTGTSLFFGTRG